VDIHVPDPRAVRAVGLGLHIIRTLQSLYPKDFAFREPPSGVRWHIDLSTGNDTLRATDTPAEDIYKAWQTDAVAFQSETVSYRLY
jgi:beta-N-acetylhexosaminidase